MIQFSGLEFGLIGYCPQADSVIESERIIVLILRLETEFSEII